MPVTLKQIREKRAEFKKFNDLYSAAGVTLNELNQAKTTAYQYYEAMRQKKDYAWSELRALGAEFAIDEGEDAIQETLNLPEQESPEIVESPFKPGAMSFGAAPLDDDIPF